MDAVVAWGEIGTVGWAVKGRAVKGHKKDP